MTTIASGTNAEATPETTTVKLTVALPKAAVEAIEEIAKKQGKTKTQVLREAIALKSFIENELAQPDTRILIERDGETRQIVFT